MNNHDEYMKLACDLAEYSVENGGGPFGAIIVSNSGNIIGKGHNRVTLDNDPTLHAEIVAIRDACKNISSFCLTDYTIYTSCEPCPMCLSALYWARIDNIYYGNTRNDAKDIGFDDEFIYNEMNVDNNLRKIPIQQICHNYAQTGFQQWKENENKIKY
jgi:tRNA(Arg) A34 adenosine deaminase TadA